MSGPEARLEVVTVVPSSTRAKRAFLPGTLDLSELRARLREALRPGMVLAEPIAARLAVARVAPDVVRGDAWLAPIERRGGLAWLRVLDAAYESVGALVDRTDALLIAARGDDAMAARARLLARLGRAAERVLGDAGLTDARRESERVADAVAHADADLVVESLGGAHLRALGIVEWAASDLAMWRVLDATLSRVGGRAAIELPVFDRPLDAAREGDPLDRLIEAVASALDDAPLTTPITSPLLMSGGPSESRARVRLTTDADAQGRAVAEVVRSALLDGAAPFEVVVAMASDDEDSGRAILRNMSEAGIECVDCRRARPRGSGLTALAILALEVAERGATRGHVARLLRSPYIDPQALLGEPDERDGRRTIRDLARALAETPTVTGESPADRLRATATAWAVGKKRNPAPLAQAAYRVGQSLTRVMRGETRADHARSARALWRDFGLDRPAAPSLALARQGVIDRLDLVDLAARARDRQAWAILSETLTSYERAVAQVGLGDAPASLETFLHELAWAHGRVPLAEPASTPEAVRMISFADLDDTPAALVVVANADAGSWPRGRPRSDLVPSALEDRLEEATDPALRPIARAGDAAVTARLVLGTSQARGLVFTYVARDDEGGARSPAPPLLPFLAHARQDTASATQAGAEPLSEREWLLATLAHRPDQARVRLPDAARRAMLERERERAFGAELPPDHPLRATLPTGEPFRAILTEETGGGTRALAASSLDTLGSCVFRGFVADVLRPRRPRDAHDVADAREAGQLTHLALEAAFGATRALWSARPRDAATIRRVALAAADRALAREQASSDLARVAVDQARSGVRAVLEWSLADEAWDFLAAEQAFGEDGAWEPLVLEQNGVRVSLRGRVDRVDVAHDGSAVRVIDYKGRQSGADSFTAALGATRFQVALYARAAQMALGLGAGSGVYLGIQRLRPGGLPKKQSERWSLAHELVGGVPRFEAHLLALVDQLRQGEVAVRPAEAASCEHCDFKGVCRKPRFAPAAPTEEPDHEDAR
jgi:hypothetical protein